MAAAFEIQLNISNHPCSWGVDYADCPTNPPWEKVIECIAASGYAGTELGPVGYYDPEKLGEKLNNLNLNLVAGNIFEKLHEPAEVPAILEKVHTSCRTLQKFGAKYFVIVPHVCPEKCDTAGRSADAPRLPKDQWDQFMSAIKQVAEITKSYGIQCTLHPHAGCWIEYEDEIERAMEDLPADLVGLCLDTGHFTYAGMDPVEKYRKYASRVPYMHFKDIDGSVLSKLQKEKGGFWDGIKSGVFCPLGKGLVNFPEVLRAMKESGFKGWVTVEQDADNSISDEQARLMKPFECCKLNVQYLRSLGVVKPPSASHEFELELNISNHPCSWGVDYADCPTNPPWEKVIECIAASGYAGTELGPVGYYNPEKLGEKLESLKLNLVAGNIFEKLHEPEEVPAILEKVHTSCRTLQKFGAKYFVIVPHVCPEKCDTAGRSADAPRLPKDQWDKFMNAIKQVAEITKSYGIQCTLHPHAGCWIEYEDEIERAMADLPADLVGLCLDTGHFTYAGMDPVEKYRKYASRVPYMHFKDIDGDVLARLQKEKGGFWDGIKSGVFCPLGKGLVNFPEVLRAMKESGFKGWVTVEQDADNSISDEQARLMKPFECCKLNVQYLRSLGVVKPQDSSRPADTFEIKLNISNHPCSWGVDYADCPTNPPWEKVIECIAGSGYAGTELGPVGYYDPEKLGQKLETLKLNLVAGNIFEKLHEPEEVPAILEKVHTSCRTLQKFGAKYFVIVPHVCPEKCDTAGRSADAPRLPKDQWDKFMNAIKQVAEITKSYGIQCTLHPHAGCWIEYEDEIERAMADLPADLVGLCLDTGHFTYAGMDPVEKYKKYASRVPYMHFKDIDGDVLAKLQKEKGGFWDGIKSGVFCPLGKGLVQFPEVLRAMKESGFKGWVTVEQDADNSISDEQARLMKPFECCKLNVQYLRSLGVVKPDDSLPPAAKFEIKLNISNHPCSWGVDYADCPTNPPWDKVIECIAASGYAGTELGPVGYYDPEKLGAKLEGLKLNLVAGNIFEKLHEAEEVPAILEKVHTSCRTLQKFGAKYFVIVPHVCPEKCDTAGRSADAPRLPKDQWDKFMSAIKQVAEITRSYGIQCTLHPHAGCWIEYEDEIERAMADLPSDLVGLCLDTGHFTYAGMDPVEKYKKYASRVPYMHFKDIDGAVLAKLQKEKGGFWDGIKSGVFCPLGNGLVDFPGVLRAMKEHGFSGWVTVEQDADNSISDEQARLMKPFECCKLNVQYLRSLGVVNPSKFTPPARNQSSDIHGAPQFGA